MNNPDTLPAAPRGPVRQLTVRMYSEADAERFDALVASKFCGKPSIAAQAVFTAGLDSFSWAHSAPDSPADSVKKGDDAVYKKLLTQPAAVCDAALNPRESVSDSSAPKRAAPLGNRLGTALGGLALAIAGAALGLALYRIPEPAAAPANPAAIPPDLSAYATKSDLAALAGRVDLDLDALAGLIRDVQKINRDQTARLDKLSPAGR